MWFASIIPKLVVSSIKLKLSFKIFFVIEWRFDYYLEGLDVLKSISIKTQFAVKIYVG